MNRRLPNVGAIATLVLLLGGASGPWPPMHPVLLDRCALLSDAEVTEALGAHERGYNGVENEWGNNSCRWTATNAAAKHPEWHDALEVAVWEANMVSWARGEMRGDPVDGVGPGARYDRAWGTVWFECAGGRVCAVRLRTAASKGRKEMATKLAHLVSGRVR
jgi:hypothetical protein